MVGNDYEKDIIPAKAVGLHTILFTKESNITIFKSADSLISSMEKLSGIIENFNSATKTKLV